MKLVLQVLKQNSLEVNNKKYSFGQNSLEYLGYIIFGQGVAAGPNKSDATWLWPLPTYVKGLHGFLGLTRY